jgi:CRISPR/Cas system CSM-associated protein Csm4 (group 5 of RAMP superfamily)
MARLKTNARKKLRKALKRVEKVVIMDIRKQLEQQRKWKAEVVKRQASKLKGSSIN